MAIVSSILYFTLNVDYKIARSRSLSEPEVKIKYNIIVVDSCEYISFSGGSSTWGSHKGNCKFCEKRK